MRPLRTCVVGVGRVGAEHARILSELVGSRLVGIHDIDGNRGEEIARKLNVQHFPALDSLLAETEAVVVAVPTAAHAEVTRAALEAGNHVLVEKPPAATLEQADRLIRAAEERSLHLGVGHVERFNGAVRLARRFLNGPLFIESLRLSPFPGRGTDVTVVLDLMIHDIDLVLGLVGCPVATVHAVGVPVISGSVDIANARLLFENGAVANITASRVSAERKRRLRLFQPSGYMSLDLIAGKGEYLRRRKPLPAGQVAMASLRSSGRATPYGAPSQAAAASDGVLETVGSADTWTAASSEVAGVPRGLSELVERVPLIAPPEEPLQIELHSFLDAIRGTPSELVSAQEGRAALEVALRINREIEEFGHVIAQDP